MISNETSISHEDVKIEEKDNKEPPKEPEDEKKDNFECNICFDSAENPVVTLCGHLFCWTCLHKWIDSQTNSLLVCPVCKAGIKHENIIPIYGRGGNNEAKKNIPQENTPERPRGQRPEPTRNPNYVPNQPTMFGGSLHFGFGAGGFHFGDGFNLGERLFFLTHLRISSSWRYKSKTSK
eukprot:gene6013-10015_t